MTIYISKQLRDANGVFTAKKVRPTVWYHCDQKLNIFLTFLQFLLRPNRPFPFVGLAGRTSHVLKGQIFRTGSVQNVPAHGSESLSSPAPVG